MSLEKPQPAAPVDREWMQTAARPASPNGRSPRLRLVDLFCGCGGLTLGVWEAARQCERRLDVRLALDANAAPLDVYRENFGIDEKTARQESVERLFDGEIGGKNTSRERYWKGRIGELDLLIAGPPCQGHSDLNNSTRRKDPRNRLYLRVVRAAEVLRPRAVIIENVPAVIHDAEGVVDAAVATLRRLSYHVSTTCVKLTAFGVPQRRRRHLLVAALSADLAMESLLPPIDHVEPTVAEALEGLEDEPDDRDEVYYQPSRMTTKNRDRAAYLFDQDVYDLPDRHRPPCHRDKPHTYRSMYGRMRWDEPAQTITSGFGSMGQGRFVHPTRPRTLTPHEAARLQGFPDFFDFSAATGLTALREMIGNAVPPQLTATLVSELANAGVL